MASPVGAAPAGSGSASTEVLARFGLGSGFGLGRPAGLGFGAALGFGMTAGSSRPVYKSCSLSWSEDSAVWGAASSSSAAAGTSSSCVVSGAFWAFFALVLQSMLLWSSMRRAMALLENTVSGVSNCPSCDAVPTQNCVRCCDVVETCFHSFL